MCPGWYTSDKGLSGSLKLELLSDAGVDNLVVLPAPRVHDKEEGSPEPGSVGLGRVTMQGVVMMTLAVPCVAVVGWSLGAFGPKR